MADILPFSGLRFKNEKIDDLSAVIAPPYDIISPQQKEKLKNLSPYNIVNLTLPDEKEPGSKYKNANEILLKWISEGILDFDPETCLYLFEESFIENGSKKNFTGFIGLLRVEEYGEGRVLRHEKTLPKPRQDRLDLLNACRANFEFIYTIYDDHDRKISVLIDPEKDKDATASAGALYDPALKFKLWKIKDDFKIKQILDFMKTKTILIADGHHRYETSRLYRESLKNNNKQEITAGTTSGISAYGASSFRPEDYVLALFVSANQEDVSIHPTHRIIKFSKIFKPEELISKLESFFKIQAIEAGEKEIIKKMSEASSAKNKNLCIYLKTGKCYFALLKRPLKKIYEKLGMLPSGQFNKNFEYLDVNILHKLILSGILKEYEIRDIKFIHTIDEVFENIKPINSRYGNSLDKNCPGLDSSGYYDAGFILNAPGIETVEELSNAGMLMPQKSTYFYPKPCSGLVMYKFDRK